MNDERNPKMSRIKFDYDYETDLGSNKFIGGLLFD